MEQYEEIEQTTHRHIETWYNNLLEKELSVFLRRLSAETSRIGKMKNYYA